MILFLVLFFCFCQQNDSITSISENVTWSGEIASIIYSNCTPCHRPGESGPFNLLTYNDAVKKAALIKNVTQTAYMPPWPADNSYTHFVGEKVLTETEKKLIKIWVETGLKKGDTLKTPPIPTYYEGSYFGKPDLVIYPQKPVQIKGNGTDVFLIMKYPYQLKFDTLLEFAEFVPHRRKLVHHVNGHLIEYNSNRTTNYMSGENIHSDTKMNLIDVYKSMNIPYADNLNPQFPVLTPNVVYYLPGYIPLAYPKEIGGYRLSKHGVFLINNIHYGPSNVDLLDSSHINLFFRKTKIERPITETQLGTFGIAPVEPNFVIEPDVIKTFTTQTVINKNISMLSINPHMHLIGKTFWAFALKPNGDTIPLIKIKKWDFRWQYYYTFKHPVKIEQGTKLMAIASFDNTKNNPNNPNFPPKTITNGNGVESMKTSEEMFQFIFTYVPYKNGDELIDLERK
ncbi:MAG: hypothetical protein JSU07_11920 [Bacteroidetes bacterium]|nr:hypothetical protein [Bacteroidota bacterium]